MTAGAWLHFASAKWCLTPFLEEGTDLKSVPGDEAPGKTR